MPIRYVKKLIYALLIVYCSQHENFVLGIIVMMGFLMIVLNLIYRPYTSKIDLIFTCVFEGMFAIGCLGICVLVVTELDFDTEQKKQTSLAVVIILLILSLLLLVYDVIRLIFEGMKLVCDRDVMGEYKDEVEQASETMNEG